jgi:hypothetical protein
MAIQLSEAARNAMLDAIEVAIGASAGARVLASVPKGDGLSANPGLRHLSAVPTKRAA